MWDIVIGARQIKLSEGAIDSEQDGAKARRRAETRRQLGRRPAMGRTQYKPQHDITHTIQRLQAVDTKHEWLQQLVARKLTEARAEFVLASQEELRRANR